MMGHAYKELGTDGTVQLLYKVLLSWLGTLWDDNYMYSTDGNAA